MPNDKMKKIIGEELYSKAKLINNKINKNVIAACRRISLKQTDFTIISNNCFGGWVYQRYNLPYQTPTIGLFFMAEDYIRFINDLKRYVYCNIDFIQPHETKHIEVLKLKDNFGTYPIGVLNDEIEIHFLHYSSEKEAKEKWIRRAERINWDRLIIKFNDQNNCSYNHLKAFDNFDYPHKICFSAKCYPELKTVIHMKEYEGMQHIIDEKKFYNKYIKITKLLNNL